MKVFDGQSADGSSLETAKIGEDRLLVWLSDDLGGGTVTVQAQAPDDTWVGVDGGSLSSTGLFIIDAVRGVRYRLSLSGASSASLDAWIEVPKLS